MNPASKLESVLNGWQSWEAPMHGRPQIVEKLNNGLVNQCWRVAASEREFVARISSEKTDGLNCRWEEELEAHRAAADIGIAPRVAYSSPPDRTMILDWGGTVATPADLQTEENLQRLAKALKRLHQTQAKLRSPGYENTLTLYHDRISTTTEVKIEQEILVYARRLDRELEHHGFCHHDLSIGNLLLCDNRVQLIDWEYARIGHTLFDLASLVDSAKLDEAQSRYLFSQYQAPASFLQELSDMLSLIHYLRDLWKQALAN